MSLWSFTRSAYLPTLLYGVGQGAIAPVVALSAREMGASVAVASLVVAATGIGQVVGDLPAGALTARIGERRAMLLAVGLVSGALVVCMLATTVWLFALAIGITGLSAAVWGLARQAYLSVAVPLDVRAQAMATLGGSMRIGMFAGSFTGAGVMYFVGIDGAYLVHLAAALLAAAVLWAAPDLKVPRAGSKESTEEPSTLRVIRQHAQVLRTLGFGALLIGALRASRLAVIPLWAHHLGLDASTTSVIFGVSGMLDAMLFYPGGWVMDRFGRRWIAVPSMVVLGAAHLMMPLTQGVVGLTCAAVLLGIGNGIGSGLVMTLGADASPVIGRSQFFGAWRLCADAGTGGGPLLIAAVATVSGLAPALLVMGATGLAGAALLTRWIPAHEARGQAEP